jgi:hypothetical protein
MNFYHYSYYIDTTRKGSGSRKRKKVFLIVKSDNVLDAQYIAENYISKLSHSKNNYELTLTEIKPIENSAD